MDDLTIRPVKPVPINDADIYHPHLPSIKRNSGSLILLVGTTNSGKTTLINNLLLNSNFWGRRKGSVMGAFENVYLFSPSLYLDDSAVTAEGWAWLFREHPHLHVRRRLLPWQRLLPFSLSSLLQLSGGQAFVRVQSVIWPLLHPPAFSPFSD